MTIDVQDAPTQATLRKRPLVGLGVGAAVSAVVAIPLSLCAVLAVWVLTEPGAGPWIGALVGIAVLLLALPVVAGLVTARVLTAVGWKIALGISALGFCLLLGPLTLAELGR